MTETTTPTPEQMRRQADWLDHEDRLREMNWKAGTTPFHRAAQMMRFGAVQAELVREACEIMQITYAGDFNTTPEGINRFLARALAASALDAKGETTGTCKEVLQVAAPLLAPSSEPKCATCCDLGYLVMEGGYASPCSCRDTRHAAPREPQPSSERLDPLQVVGPAPGTMHPVNQPSSEASAQQTEETWTRDLITAWWRERRVNTWVCPDGLLWRGPHGAWCELQRRKAETLELRQ